MDVPIIGRGAPVTTRQAARTLRIDSPTGQESSRPVTRPKDRRSKRVVQSSDSEQTASDGGGMTEAERLRQRDLAEARARLEAAKRKDPSDQAQSSRARSPSDVPCLPPVIPSPPRRERTVVNRPGRSTARIPSSSTVAAATDLQPSPISPTPEAAKRQQEQARGGSQERPLKRLRLAAMVKKATR